MPSALEEYRRTYGARLRAELSGVPPQTYNSALAQNDPRFRSPMTEDQATPGDGTYVPPQDPVEPMEPGGTADPTGGQDMGGPMGQDSALDSSQQPKNGGGYTFRDMYKDAPNKVKEAQVDKLEEALKRGNETIDSAYDELERQLGTRPDKKKLSRQEKGMLLMEFGLNVLANNKKGFGAIGMAGGKALANYNEMATGPQKDYDQTKAAVDVARAKSKVKLAEGSALENLKQPASVGSRLPGRFTGDDGFVYFYDENGQVQQAKDAAGKPIKASQQDSAMRPNDFDVKRKAYLEVFGVDPKTGQPLTGLARVRVEQDAVEFAADRGTTIDDLDLDILAERSADEEMKADAYRDLTSEQREAKRSEIATSRRLRLKRPVRSYLEPNEPKRGRPDIKARKFSSIQEAREAFKRGEIKAGDLIEVNGVVDTVE